MSRSSCDIRSTPKPATCGIKHSLQCCERNRQNSKYFAPGVRGQAFLKALGSGFPDQRWPTDMAKSVTPARQVVVCGAGVVGASVAYFLALRGVAVTVVERSGVACAASGKSGGFLALDWCEGSALGPLARARFALHAELEQKHGADYGYQHLATFMLAARERGRLAGGHRVAAPSWLDDAGVGTGGLGPTRPPRPGP